MKEYRGFKIEKVNTMVKYDEVARKITKYVAKNKYYNYFNKTSPIITPISIFSFMGLAVTTSHSYNILTRILAVICIIGLTQFIMYLILKPCKLEHKELKQLKLLIDYEKDHAWGKKE